MRLAVVERIAVYDKGCGGLLAVVIVRDEGA
jgi:hypothetical protein